MQNGYCLPYSNDSMLKLSYKLKND